MTHPDPATLDIHEVPSSRLARALGCRCAPQYRTIHREWEFLHIDLGVAGELVCIRRVQVRGEATSWVDLEDAKSSHRAYGGRQGDIGIQRMHNGASKRPYA